MLGFEVYSSKYDFSVLVECDTVKDSYKEACSMARRWVYKYNDTVSVKCFEWGNYPCTVRKLMQVLTPNYKYYYSNGILRTGGSVNFGVVKEYSVSWMLENLRTYKAIHQ